MKLLTRRNFLKVAGVSLTGAGFIGCSDAANNQKLSKNKTKPNILLIMADDMGFSDIGCYGSEINTPNINSLAAQGLRYTQFYNTGRCCPTRASLLTGLYSHKAGMGWMTSSNLGHPGYIDNLNDKCITIAQALKPAGYRCYMTGKWHVVRDTYMKPDGPKDNWPLQRGFDKYYGGLSGGGSYYVQPTLTDGNKRIKTPDNYYYTDAMTDKTVEYLNSHFAEHKDKPFFMYVAYYAPHRPLHAKPADIAKYKGKYMVGWDKIRADRYKRQVQMGLIDDDWDLSKRDKSVPAWGDVPEKKKKLWDMRMATYAAQIDCMDQNIGKIFDTLKKNNALDNTVIIFLSDNGGCAENAGNGDISIIGTAKSSESYHTAWANASNTPFKYYKHFVHEGGISTPLIVKWPKGLTRPKGSINKKTIGHVIDLMPTCLELAHGQYPKTYNGKKIYQPAGVSLVPTFTGGELPQRPLYFEHEANRAVRLGKWNLVSKGTSKPPYTGPWELYDMENDRTEINDLSQKHPEIVEKLKGLWHKWALENNVYPLDGRGWNTKVKASID